MDEAFSAGADLDAPIAAAELRSPLVARSFRSLCVGERLVFVAVNYMSSSIFEWLVRRGADLQGAGAAGRQTLLLRAVANGRVDVLRVMVDAGVDLRGDPHAGSLFQQLVGKPTTRPDLIELLLDAGLPLGTEHQRSWLAGLARKQGEPALAQRIENTPLG